MGSALVGPVLALTTDSDVIIEGDSMLALNTSTQLLAITKRRLYALADETPGGPRPRIWDTALSSTGMAAILARMQIAIPLYHPSAIIGLFGTAALILAQTIGTVNDTTNATILGAFGLFMDITAGSSIPTYVATVGMIGEKHPDGANGAGDTSINTLITGMDTITRRYPTYGTLRDMRAAIYSVYSATYNVANATMGGMTTPDPLGVHDNPGGRGLYETVFRNDITLSAASTAALGVANWSSTTDPAPSALGIDYDPSTASGAGDGGNVSTWANSGLSTGANLVTASATKPVYRAIAHSGKFNNAPGIQFGGASWLRSAAFTAKAQPFMLMVVWESTNFTANQILIDGVSGTQEGYLATIATSGIVQYDSGTAVNGPAITTGTQNCAIVYFAGNRAGSYMVLNGVQQALADAGGNYTRSQMTIGAAVSNGLPTTGIFVRIKEYYSSLSTLPRWQDVNGWAVAKYGAMGV